MSTFSSSALRRESMVQKQRQQQDPTPARHLPTALILHRLEEVSRATMEELKELLDLPPVPQGRHGPPPQAPIQLTHTNHQQPSGGGLESTTSRSNVSARSANILSANSYRTAFGATTALRSVTVLGSRQASVVSISAPLSVLSLDHHGSSCGSTTPQRERFGSIPCDAPPSLSGSSNLYSGRNLRAGSASESFRSSNGWGNNTNREEAAAPNSGSQSPEGLNSTIQFSGALSVPPPMLGASSQEEGPTKESREVVPKSSSNLGQLSHQKSGRTVGGAGAGAGAGASVSNEERSDVDIIWLEEPPATSKHKSEHSPHSTSSGAATAAVERSGDVRVIDFGFEE